LINIGFTWV